MHVAWIGQHKFECKNHLGALNQRFGFDRTTSNHRTSSFLLHTPIEALQNTIFAPSRYIHHEFQTPASIFLKKRLSNQQTTTMQSTILSTTPLRGDQQPPIDDDNQDGIDAIVPLGQNDTIKFHPVTVHPIYFINERDRTSRRITKKKQSYFYVILSSSMSLKSLSFNVHCISLDLIPASEPGKSSRIFSIFVHIPIECVL